MQKEREVEMLREQLLKQDQRIQELGDRPRKRARVGDAPEAEEFNTIGQYDIMSAPLELFLSASLELFLSASLELFLSASLELFLSALLELSAQVSHAEAHAMELFLPAPLELFLSGNKYVLVVSDIFSKYVNLYAIPRQDAATVADKLFRDFIGQHGVPDQLHSDQGPQYESHLISELCTRLGIRKSRTSPCHPQGDGQVERFNRTMKDILAKCLAGRENDWDRILPHVALAYNTSLHTTTKRSPFYLVHGREARLPVDVACQLPATTAHLADLTTAITSVRDAIAQSYQTQDQQQAPRVNYHQYRVGDRVWLHHPPSALYKLRLPWTGPFTVIASLPPGEPAPILYRIQPDTGCQRQQVVHHNRLKPYITPTLRLLPAPPATAPDNRRRLPDAGHLGFAGFMHQHHLRPPDLPAAQPDPPAPVPVQLPASEPGRPYSIKKKATDSVNMKESAVEERKMIREEMGRVWRHFLEEHDCTEEAATAAVKTHIYWAKENCGGEAITIKAAMDNVINHYKIDLKDEGSDGHFMAMVRKLRASFLEFHDATESIPADMLPSKDTDWHPTAVRIIKKMVEWAENRALGNSNSNLQKVTLDSVYDSSLLSVC
ncbi:NYNRIN [Branchiostoma lanceolatum]|uniref:NYNRIN protein n=1 Tax=Branchiostoma lanceolatum TaxID=7740 RepID=A0A8K0E5T7_BRALA|nr:NYNRIN [Branchiostoma lanceolatum]